MKTKRCCLLLTSAALCAGLLGCAAASPAAGSPAPSQAQASAEPAAEITAEAAQAPEEGTAATLYIGDREAGFREYPLNYTGELTPELLIQGIADRTGWDLTLAQPVSDGKGGMSVCLADSSSLFQGPPEPQKDEFHMFSAEQLARTILDSIQKTLQCSYVMAPGDPDNLDVYYYMEDGGGLELPDLGLSWPLEEPYQWPAE